MIDVHASPYCPSINYTVNISKQRFDMRNATIVNMIDSAMAGRMTMAGKILLSSAVQPGSTSTAFDVVAKAVGHLPCACA